MRKFPVFPIFGDGGTYCVQPVYVGDLARIAIASVEQNEIIPIDAIGPENYTFEAFIHLIADTIGRRVVFMKMPPTLGIFFGKLVANIPAGCDPHAAGN